jgi:hypothetical protein
MSDKTSLCNSKVKKALDTSIKHISQRIRDGIESRISVRQRIKLTLI